jgi:hypothetical protein
MTGKTGISLIAAAVLFCVGVLSIASAFSGRLQAVEQGDDLFVQTQPSNADANAYQGDVRRADGASHIAG